MAVFVQRKSPTTNRHRFGSTVVTPMRHSSARSRSTTLLDAKRLGDVVVAPAVNQLYDLPPRPWPSASRTGRPGFSLRNLCWPQDHSCPGNIIRTQPHRAAGGEPATNRRRSITGGGVFNLHTAMPWTASRPNGFVVDHQHDQLSARRVRHAQPRCGAASQRQVSHARLSEAAHEKTSKTRW